MKIVVTGSLAYDRIMPFPEYFSDHILPDKIHVLNVCFQVDGVTENFGGTAGNIGYALKLLGVDPYISATIGKDYHRYFDWLKENGISLDGIKCVEGELTAGAYITTDKGDNQITGFNPGAMKVSSELNFDSFDVEDTILIASPGNLEDMIKYTAKCKELGIRSIFDPGQSLPVLDSTDLKNAIDGIYLLTVNDYEFDLIKEKTGLSSEEIFARAENTIITLGEHGSRLCTKGERKEILPYKTEKVVDPTGCGDAYRAGLLYGLTTGNDLYESAKLASVCASFAVECHGTQEYTFTMDEFKKRLS